MRRIRFTIAVVIAVVVVLLKLVFTYQVRETEVVVKTFFGGDPQVITQPGLKLRWPSPINPVHRFDTRVQVSERTLMQTSTRDTITVIVSTSVGWRISDPLTFLTSTDGGDMEIAEERILSLVDSHRNSVLGLHLFSSLVSIRPEPDVLGEAGLPAEPDFDSIEKEMTRLVRADASSDYGVEVEFVRISNLTLPQEVTAKVFDRMRRERKNIADAKRGDARGTAIDIRARADSERAIILGMAEGRATKRRARGDAEAEKHYRVLAQDEELAIFLSELRTMRKTLKGQTTIILESGNSPYHLLRGELPETSGSR